MHFSLSEEIKQRLRYFRLVSQLHRQRQVPAARGKLRIDKYRLAAARRVNRDSLRHISNWIDEKSMQNSLYKYGTSEQTREVVNHEIGDCTTYSDLLATFCGLIERPNYLEIGVSVGKNFWQVINSKKIGNFWGLDIENINAVLERKLTFVSQSKILSSFKSPRTEEGYVSRFLYEGSSVSYSAGDVYDDAVWSAFDRQKFSLIFSDASHTPTAIRSEWKQITSRDLLDRNGFTMVWDDLNTQEMRTAFNEFVIDSGERYGVPPNNACLTHVHGWVGTKEPYHPIGIISTHGFIA
jgi:hypothetical protein